MKKKIAALVLAMIMVTSLAACVGGPSESPDPSANPLTEPSAVPSGAASGKTYTIGICQLMQHSALDAATQGFQEKLEELLEAHGDSVVWDLQNASGETTTCATICNQFVSSGVDLIMANATASLQAAMTATNSIPILGTSITDYGTAMDVSDWTGTTGINVSGTSDLAPLDEQAALIREMYPDAEKIGILYCSAEPNSKYQSDLITRYLTDMGYTCTNYTFSDSNDLQTVAGSAAAESDVIYVPTDNTAATNASLIGNVCIPAGVPVITGEEGTCIGCGVATLTISYYDLGVATAEMAYDILVNGADPAAMEISYAPQVTKKYNPEICETLNVTPPADAAAIEIEE